MDSKTLPPYAEETERAALGCVLLAPDAAGKLLSMLRLDYFFDQRHRTIFKAMLKVQASGQSLDLITLVQFLRDKAHIQDAGNDCYVAALPDAAPSAANLDYYLPTLKDKAARRALLQLAGRASQLASDESLDARELQREFTELAGRVAERGSEQKEWFRFYTPSECRNFDPPAGLVLVGDNHIVRGATTVIAGPPGVGKSRSGHSLALSGASVGAWFDLQVHRRFKSAILQNENGLLRLKQEFTEIGVDGLDDFIRVSKPPPYGMAFENAGFRTQLARWLEEWAPDLVIFYPWNSAARDDAQRDYRALFDNLNEVLPKGDTSPALVIIAHTRKPRGEERKSGRGLLNDVAGSHILASVPRCVFVMQPASDDVEDDRVVWTCCKNNDGQLGQRSAWYRRNGLFSACADFDWAAFDSPAKEHPGTISKEHLDRLFDGGRRKLVRKVAVAELVEKSGCKKTACYAALELNGRFREHLSGDDTGLLAWTP